jgi:hypothetical protein
MQQFAAVPFAIRVPVLAVCVRWFTLKLQQATSHLQQSGRIAAVRSPAAFLLQRVCILFDELHYHHQKIFIKAGFFLKGCI